MLWRSVLVRDDASLRRQITGVDAVELRLDLLDRNTHTAIDWASLPDAWTLATYHGDDWALGRWLLQHTPADFYDLPCVPGKALDTDGFNAPGEHIFIGSHHDYEHTPSRAKLEELVDEIFASGYDIAKVACLCQTPREAARLIGLMDDPRPVIAIGMGPAGRLTRVAAALWAPGSFVPADEPTAPGQLPEATVREILRLLAEQT